MPFCRFVFLATLLWPALVGAAEAESSPVGHRTPPVVTYEVPPVYPEGASGDAVVVLRVTINADGNVADAVIVSSAGLAFDEAARAAALQTRFQPAHVDGAPVTARISYRITFVEPRAAEVEDRATDAGVALAEAPTVPAGDVKPIDVTIHGARPEGERLSRSSAAVDRIELREARLESADLGAVLAREAGVSLQSGAGLGSAFRLSLNGLYDDQIRVFVDSVPIAASEFPNGIANVPVNLLERVDVYRGVVPIRYGVDALGGIVDMVRRPLERTRLSAGYQVGSFGTHRFNVDGSYFDSASGLFAGGSAYADLARNDYSIDVDVADPTGALTEQRVRRFHDAYRALGASLAAGILDRSWARRLVVRAFASTFDKDIQNNVVMTVPYGAATYGGHTYGASVRYQNALSSAVALDATLAYARNHVWLLDITRNVYDWRGEVVSERTLGGEIQGRPIDRALDTDTFLARPTMSVQLSPEQTLRLVAAPTFATRTGVDRDRQRTGERDPLAARSNILTLVSGIEHEASLREDAVRNVLFVKDYVYAATTDEAVPGGSVRPLSRTSHGLGFGDSLRVDVSRWLALKASYEYARRLPSVDEVFGNGVLVRPNLRLEPEVSHNVNVGPRVELHGETTGDLMVDVSGFMRLADQLILLLGDDVSSVYANVYRARIAGVEGTVEWTSRESFLSAGMSFTAQDARNASADGTFGAFDGERLPNRPWLLASWNVRLLWRNVAHHIDVSPYYYGRYVHRFPRFWEGLGDTRFKSIIPSQLTHDIGVSFISELGGTLSIDLRNVTDARIFDFFGVQRPGRAVFAKLTFDL